MSSIEVRPFRRGDREQLAALVNAHAAAVVPGASVSVNTVMNQLEREPGEFIVDPWVMDRATLVADQRGRIVAAAHLLRYASGEEVSDSYRDAAEIRWFLYWPEAPYWPDSDRARDALMTSCLGTLDRWGAPKQYADGALPVPGVYGVPDQWPHVRTAYEQAGFSHRGNTEIVYIAKIHELPMPGEPPIPGVVLRRSVGINGTRLSAAVGDETAGYIEVETLEDAGRVPRNGGMADIGNLHVLEKYRRRGLATWLIGKAREWLILSRTEQVLAYASPEEVDCTSLLEAVGFGRLTRTERGWVRDTRVNPS